MQTGIVIVNYNDYESTFKLVENIKKVKNIGKNYELFCFCMVIRLFFMYN